MLYSAIVTEIINEVGGDSSDTTLSTLVLGFVKSALRRFPRHTRSRFLYTAKSVTLAQAATSATLPTGFVRERAVYYVDDGNRVDIEKLSFDDFNSQYNSSASGTPQNGYRIIGNAIEFLRAADKAYTIYIECLQEIDDIESTDTFPGDSSIVEILKDGAKYYYYDYEEDEKRCMDKLALFKAGLDKLDADFLSDDIPDHINES